MSGLDSGNRKDYSKFDRMSTESLEELLRLDAELPDGEGSDIDEILYISEVIAKREEEHPTGRYAEIDVEAAWETFQTKYRPFVTDGRSLYDFDDDEPGSTETASPAPGTSSPSGKNRISTQGRRCLGRVASFAAAIAILLGLMTVTAYAMGYDLWGVIAQWTKETFTFVSVSKINDTGEPSPNTTEEEYVDLQAALDAYGVTEQLAPKWIPDGFSVVEVIVDATSKQSDISFYELCESDDKTIIISVVAHHNQDNATFATWQKNEPDVATYEIGTCTFYIMENEDQLNAVWTQGSYECGISGDVTLDEMYQIINSIFEKD